MAETDGNNDSKNNDSQHKTKDLNALESKLELNSALKPVHSTREKS